MSGAKALLIIADTTMLIAKPTAIAAKLPAVRPIIPTAIIVPTAKA
jgi:hypothetical protein